MSYKGRAVKKNCLNCHTQFDAEVKELNRGNAKFCKRSCSSQWRRDHPKVKTPNCTCANCQAKFYKSASKLKASKSGLVFCSRTCKDTAQKIGGIKEIQPSHYTDSRKDYRKTAKEFLKHKCSNCGYDKHPEVLQVHHKDRNREDNSIENLEILCPTCHEEDHFLAKDGRFSSNS